MKKTLGILLVLMLPVFLMAQKSKADCKVLVEDLQGEYRGECKKGLAHGEGSAQGKHIYEGQFKKGYPDGEGKYIWSGDDYYVGNFRKGKRNGYGKHYMMVDGKSSFIEGYWSNDAYTGKNKRVKKYNTISKAGIERVSYAFKGNNGTNEVIIRFKRAGTEIFSELQQLSMTANSGDEVSQSNRFGYENMKFPFKADLSFAAPAKMDISGMTIQCRLSFEIFVEGSWEISVYI